MKRLMWVNLVVGLWLIISPWALRYDAAAASATAATANAVILGDPDDTRLSQ